MHLWCLSLICIGLSSWSWRDIHVDSVRRLLFSTVIHSLCVLKNAWKAQTFHQHFNATVVLLFIAKEKAFHCPAEANMMPLNGYVALLSKVLHNIFAPCSLINTSILMAAKSCRVLVNWISDPVTPASSVKALVCKHKLAFMFVVNALIVLFLCSFLLQRLPCLPNFSFYFLTD